VTTGPLAAESLPAFDAVLEAVVEVDRVDVVGGVDDAVPATPCCVAAATDRPAGGSSSTPGDGRASLLAAQASEDRRAKETSTGIDDDLWETYCISSTQELLICWKCAGSRD
jgi:hypothetical protein